MYNVPQELGSANGRIADPDNPPRRKPDLGADAPLFAEGELESLLNQPRGWADVPSRPPVFPACRGENIGVTIDGEQHFYQVVHYRPEGENEVIVRLFKLN